MGRRIGTHTSTTFALALALASCSPPKVGSTPPGTETGSPPPEPVSSRPPCPRGPRAEIPSARMNCLFREVYGARRDAATQDDRFTIVDNFGDVSLVRGGKRLEHERVTSPTFQALKEHAHVPLGVFLLLGADDPVPDVTVEDYLKAVDSALGSLDVLEGLSDEQRARCRKISEASRALLREARAGDVTDDELRAFARAMGPLVEANAADAAFAYLDPLVALVQKLRKERLATAWDEVRVLIRGSHQARRLYVSTQYFAGVFGECGDGLSYPGESPRLLFSEQLSPRWEPEDGDPDTLDPSGANTYADLIGTTLVDAEASEAFFGDPNRLSIDILAPGATEFARERGLKTLPCR